MIKATIVLLVAHAVIPVLRGRSAAQRHVLWTVTLLVAALLPVLNLLMPSWQPEWMRRVADAVPSSLGSIQPWAAGPNADIIVRATGIEPAGVTVGTVVPWLWVGGIAIAFLFLAIELVKLARLASSSHPVSDEPWLRIAGEVADALGLSRPPKLLQSARALIPVAWGLRQAKILLPADAVGWSDERRRAVLAHELAHIHRGDWAVHILVELIAAIYWFHPLFWTARNRLLRESEHAADDRAIALGTSGADYAAHLVAIVRAARLPVRPWSPTVAMARGSHLQRRVTALLDVDANRASVTRRTVGTAIMTAAAVALPLAAINMPGAGMDIEIRTTNLPALTELTGTVGQAGAASQVPTLRVVGIVPEVGVAAPEVIEYTTPPLYSDEARRLGIEGVVTVHARVDADGQVSGIRIVKGAGFGLDQNALVALRQWRFRSGKHNGTPMAMEVELDIAFTLRSEAVNALIANDMATLVGPGVTPPRVVRVGSPPARTRSARGTVVLDVVLLEDGMPRIVRILRSLGPELDESAVRSFEQWRFSPALKDGRPIKVRVHAQVNFHE